MSTSTREATTVVEYGVQLTWPDGHVEYRKTTRDSAESDVRYHNKPGRNESTAEVVTREVTTTAWEVAR